MPAMQIQVRSTTLAYDDHGAGRPIVLIHGYPLNRALWAPQRDGLADQVRVLTPDLHGHGDSDAPAGPYTMDDFADECAAWLDAIGVTGPVVFGGLSMGGYVTFAFWRRHPERVAALILAATRAGADSAEARAGRATAMATAERAGVATIVDGMLPKLLAPGALESQPELAAQVRAMMLRTPLTGMLGDLAGLRDRADSTPTLASITVPTLVIHGARDQLIPLAEAERLRDGIAGARLAIIDEAGHLPNLEQPDVFNAAIRTFVTSL